MSTFLHFWSESIFFFFAFPIIYCRYVDTNLEYVSNDNYTKDIPDSNPGWRPAVLIDISYASRLEF